jgi:tRNA pseudouridine38-40 synthase
MRVIRLDIAYDGTGFSGWQRQPEGRRTVQGVLEETLARVLQGPVTLHGAGRTDAGVHALGQVASFTTERALPAERLFLALRTMLPRDLSVTSVVDAPWDFHARFSAKGKIYRYLLTDGRVRSPFLTRYAWEYPRSLDTDLMREGASHLVGTHDFTSFAASTADLRSAVRTIRRIDLFRRGERIHLLIEGDGFLHHMCRNIVGTLTSVGRSRIPAGRIADILAARDRGRAGATAPPQGLCLAKVHY